VHPLPWVVKHVDNVDFQGNELVVRLKKESRGFIGQKGVNIRLVEYVIKLLNKGDLVDACEKYYKAAREAIILLAYKYNIHGDNIEDIVTKLAEILGDNIISYWAGASLLYTARKELDAELINRQDVVELVNLANEKFVCL
jgi:hypothetical protein